MAFSYRQVKDLYDQLRDAGATSVSLPEWSDQMNQLTGTDLYGQGRNDNLLKRGSVAIDRALEWTGLPTATRSLGERAGALVGNPSAGADIGEGLPRMAVNMLPFLIPGAGWGAAGAGLLSGAEAYTKTGSPASGIVSGVLNAALPKVTGLAEQAVLRRMGVQALSGPITRELGMENGNITKLVTEASSRLYPETVGQRVASFGGGQVAAAGLMEGQRWGEEGFSGQPLHNPFTTENLLNYTLGQLPFAGIHGVSKLAGAANPRVAHAEAIAHTEKLLEQKAAQDRLAEQTDIEKIPIVAPAWTPEQIDKLVARRSELRQKQAELLAKPAPTPEDTQALNDAVAADNATPLITSATSALGAEQGGEHVSVTGTQIHETPKWRKILVSDDESNPPELRGQVVEYSKGLREPTPAPSANGLSTFGVTSDPLWRTIKTPADETNRQLAYAEARKASVGAKAGAGTLELPEQTTPAVNPFAHISELDSIEVAVDAAKTPAQLQKALLSLRFLQESMDREPFNDIQLERVKAKIAEKDTKIDPTKAALTKEMAKLKRQVDAEERARKVLGLQPTTDPTETQARAAVRDDRFSLPKVSDDTQPIHDFIDEVISGEQSRKDFEQSYEQWRKTTKSNEITSLGKEKERFKIYWKMKQSGEVGAEEMLSESDARTLNDEFKAQGIEVTDAKTLQDYPERDHVLNWNDAVTEKLVEGKAHAPVPQQVKSIATDYLPAIKVLGEELVGNQGETHQDILNRYVAEHPDSAAEALVDFDTKENPNYFKKGDEVVSREQLQASLGVKDSQGLRDLQAKEQATLGDSSRAPQAKVPRGYNSDVPAQQEVISKLTTDGHGLVRELLSDSDPRVVAWGKDVAQRFPAQLFRLDSGVYDIPGSFAARRRNNAVGLFFDRSLTTASPSVRNTIIQHELVHGLTLHEMNDPRVDPKIIAELTTLRERLIEKLPPKVREAYDNAISSEWMARYRQNAATLNELHPESKYQQIIYGLLDNNELAAQGFTSRDLQEFMASHPGTKRGESAYKTFTNWVKSLLDFKVDSTLLGDFIHTTSQLMANGEFLADFGNFGERYFESQGKPISYARAQTDRALGLVADSAYGLHEPLTIASALDLSASKSTANLELRKAKRDYEAMRRDSAEDSLHVDSVLGELGHKNIDELVTSTTGEGEDISDALALLPPEATRYVYEKLRDSHDVLDVIRAASMDSNKGMTNLANPKLLQQSVAPVLKNIRRALKHEEFEQYMAIQLAGLGKVTPEGLLDSVPSMTPKVYEDFVEGAKDIGGKGLKSLAWYLETIGQWARRVPEVAEPTSKGWQLGTNSRKMFHEAVKWLGMDTSSPYVDVLTHESTQQTEKVSANPKLADKVNRWMFWNNKKGADNVVMLSENDSDIAKLLGGLSDKERQDVHDIVAKNSKMTQMAHVEIQEKMQQIAVTHGAGVAALSTRLKTKDNIALARDTLLGIQQSADPLNAQRGQALLQGVQQRMQPEAFIELYDFSKGEADKLALWKKYFDANPAWATAQRTERFIFDVFNKRGELLKSQQASTRKEAYDTIAKKGYKLKGEIKDNWAGREDEPFAFPNMSPEMAKRMQEIEDNQIQRLSKVLSPEDLAEVQRTSPVTQILREAQAVQSIPGVQTPPRLLSQGAEELPWMWNHISWAQREANYWSRQLLRAQARTYLRDVEIKSLPESEQQKLKTHFENLLMPDPKIAQQITRLNSTWFLGFNAATSIINAAQPFVTHVSELTSMTGKPIDSYKRVMRALDEVAGKSIGKKDWASPEHEKLMHEAVKDGEVGIGMFDDEAAAQEAIATNFKRAMKKETPKTLGEQLGTAAGAYSKAGMWLFQHGERVNSRAALLAGFDYYREQGLSFVEAKEKAYEFNHAVNFGGGRAQRPVGAYSSRSPFLRGAAMLGTSLQSYVLGTTAQIVRHLQRGFFRPQGLTPHETYAARRAAIQMLATQFAAAGVLGLPFVSGAISLLDKAFPELELNRKLREGVNDFVSSDKENGSILTDIAMTGVPSSLGWDMQSRLSMGNTLPGVSEVNGFQPENLLGPTANLVRNFVNGTTGFVRGDPKAGSNFLPPAVRKMIEAGQASLSSGQAGGGIQDYQGRPLASPTPGEYVGALLGFQPTRLSQQNSAARMLKQSEEVIRTQESRFRQAQAEDALKGNFGSIRQELRARKEQEKDYDDVAAVQAIARAAEESAFPRDLRREGTTQGSKVRGFLLQSFGSQGGQASEVDRLRFRKEIEQRLGLQSDGKEELKIAMLMDQLKLINPGATRLELKSAALEASRRARSRELLSVK